MARAAPHTNAGNPPQRGRGRPKGSAPYQARDEALLARFADAVLEEPGLKLAPFLRARASLGESEIRRLQIRWRGCRERLLAEAELRAQASATSLLDLLSPCILALAQLAETLTEGAFAAIQASMSRAQHRRAAREFLGLPDDPVVDLSRPEDLAAALARAEAGLHPPDSPEVKAMFAGRTTAELTPSMRLYSFAVLLHEESLRQRQRELEQGRATTPPLDPPRTTESDR